jgi:hypothetical protein
MKKLTILAAALLAAAGAARAATAETMTADLEKAGISVNVGTHQPAPQPGVPHPVHQNHPAQPQHPSHPVNPGHPGYPPPQPWNPGHQQPQPWEPGYQQPWNPGQPGQPGYPPYYPPQVQMQQFRFESSNFVFSSDARSSMENAAAALARAGYTVLEKRNNYTAYTLVFLAPSYLKVEKYTSGTFVFSSDAKKAAEECVKAMEGQGKVVLETNVTGTSFVVSYLNSGQGWQFKTQTYQSGNFVFSSDARASMDEAAAALQSVGAVILEKRLTGTSYTIVFQGFYTLDPQGYDSGNFVFSSDAKRSMDEAAAALQRVRGLVILEKRLTGTSYHIQFLSHTAIQPQKYVSGNYTFSSDAKRAAEETAAAFASQGLIVIEKNVCGTQYTITYFHPGYY